MLKVSLEDKTRPGWVPGTQERRPGGEEAASEPGTRERQPGGEEATSEPGT